MRYLVYTIFFIGSLISINAYAESILQVDDIARKLICPCGCNMLLYECESNMTCDVARRVKSEIQGMVDQGMNEDQIIEEMRVRYGSWVLAVPPKQGFTLTLWTYPIIGAAVGSVMIYLLTRRRKDVKWVVDPDEVPEIDEERFEELQKIDLEEKVGETPSKYDKIFRQEYEKLRKRRDK